MRVYPNPSRDVVRIDSGSDYIQINEHTLNILNTVGQEVFSGPINSETPDIPVVDIGEAGI